MDREIKFPMYQENVSEWLMENPHNAKYLLDQANLNFSKRFKRIDKQLAALLKEVQTYFPDARYYSENSSEFYLMLGNTHSEGGRLMENKKFVALIGDAIIDGGAW